jgi:hypothetical protein
MDLKPIVSHAVSFCAYCIYNSNRPTLETTTATETPFYQLHSITTLRSMFKIHSKCRRGVCVLDLEAQLLLPEQSAEVHAEAAAYKGIQNVVEGVMQWGSCQKSVVATSS